MHSALALLADRVRAAAADDTPLRIRGGGTRAFYGDPVEGEDLDLRAYAGIVDYEPSELVVTVRAGTPLAELEALLAERGQCLPFEPPRFAVGGTVGGMVSAGLSGPARASVGAVRDYLLGVQLLNGRAEVLDFGGQVMKNVAGYDVSRLIAGSLGRLGVITQVSLKVLPVPPAEATLRFRCDQDEALELLHGWGGQPWPLNASCWLPDDPSDQAGRTDRIAAPTGTLYLRLRGAVAAVHSACTHLGGIRHDPDDAARRQVADDWSACRDQRLPWFAGRPPGHDLWRLSVPQTAPVLCAGVPGIVGPLVEWHGAQRWYQADATDAQAGATLRRAAQGVGGHAVRFHCADPATRERFDAQSPALERIHAALRQSFDPAGIFNRPRAPVLS